MDDIDVQTKYKNKKLVNCKLFYCMKDCYHFVGVFINKLSINMWFEQNQHYFVFLQFIIMVNGLLYNWPSLSHINMNCSLFCGMGFYGIFFKNKSYILWNKKRPLFSPIFTYENSSSNIGSPFLHNKVKIKIFQHT